MMLAIMIYGGNFTTIHCQDFFNLFIKLCRTLLGGLLSEKFIGKPEPKRAELNTSSLAKYKYSIDQWGNWNLFQV
jgi:hypothetical protein